MKIHEYQAKQLFRQMGLPLPEGEVAFTPEEAKRVAEKLRAGPFVVKAQIHAGGRGQAGGVRLCRSGDEVVEASRELLGRRLITAQTGPEGLPVSAVLVERAVPVLREFYLALLVDRESRRVALVASQTGGMAIEEIASRSPQAVLKFPIHPALGPADYQIREIGFTFGLDPKPLADLQRIVKALYRLFLEKEATLIEINPLALTDAGQLLLLDAKLEFDPSGVDLHPEIAALRDPSQEDERERIAREHGLSYISLDGDIGCMVNGAGLAMATLDLIAAFGGRPANFLDVGGGTSAERVAVAFRLILSDPKVQVVLVNIFGGIVRCDLIAEGILKALSEIEVEVPVVVRLEGTHAEQGRMLLEASPLEIIASSDLEEAARRAVELAR